MQTRELLKQAIKAINKEIEAVLERPSEEELFKGKQVDGGFEEYRYVFETSNASIQYAEKVKAEIDEKTYKATPVDYNENKLTLAFEDNLGKEIDSAFLEWENDYILRCIKDRLEDVCDLDEEDDTNELHRIRRMLSPEAETETDEPALLHDNMRNSAQLEALKIAATQPVSYIWGPPGTGKTSTLGFIIANYLLAGKRVLFASNTNRAVDIGLISTMDALQQISGHDLLKDLTRFGESALDSESLQQVLFANQLDKFVKQRREEAGKLANLLDNYKAMEEKLDKIANDGGSISSDEESRMITLQKQVKAKGGKMLLEDKIQKLATSGQHAEFKLIRNKKLVATTLAKVCTSDLTNQSVYDAVVVDESSMASLPYLLVMASAAKEHLVLVGDPMQLPPISVTNHAESRDFLEQDIYSYVSGAKTPGEQFAWHDKNPEYTAFFDTQFRLQQDLADVISAVFYEGRLKSAESVNGKNQSKASRSTHLVNSSKLNPKLVQDKSRSGFRPQNDVHGELIVKLITKLLKSQHAVMNDIGIILPFRSVVWDLRKKLRDEGYGAVEVGTIHTFQGREKQIIIFDTVMTADYESGFPRHYSVRPFDEDKNGLSVPRLLNVAFSRCKKNLFVIADMDHINKIYRGKFLHKLLVRLTPMSVERLLN